MWACLVYKILLVKWVGLLNRATPLPVCQPVWPMYPILGATVNVKYEFKMYADCNMPFTYCFEPCVRQGYKFHFNCLLMEYFSPGTDDIHHGQCMSHQYWWCASRVLMIFVMDITYPHWLSVHALGFWWYSSRAVHVPSVLMMCLMGTDDIRHGQCMSHQYWWCASRVLMIFAMDVTYPHWLSVHASGFWWYSSWAVHVPSVLMMCLTGTDDIRHGCNISSLAQCTCLRVLMIFVTGSACPISTDDVLHGYWWYSPWM